MLANILKIGLRRRFIGRPKKQTIGEIMTQESVLTFVELGKSFGFRVGTKIQALDSAWGLMCLMIVCFCARI